MITYSTARANIRHQGVGRTKGDLIKANGFIDDSSPLEASRGFASLPGPKWISALRPNKKPRNERGLIESDARVQRKSKAKGFLPGSALGPL
jgi:hypothetical protein